MTDDVLARKATFAEALLRAPDNPFIAAQKAIPDDIEQALIAAREWPLDADVVRITAELVEASEPEEFLPDKVRLARDVYELATHPTVEPKDRIAAMKLYADLRDFVPKQGTTVNNNLTVDNRKVMIVKDHGEDDAWERKLAAQQAKLIDDAAKPHSAH